MTFGTSLGELMFAPSGPESVSDKSMTSLEVSELDPPERSSPCLPDNLRSAGSGSQIA